MKPRRSQYFLKDCVVQGPVFHRQIKNHPYLKKLKRLPINIIQEGKQKKKKIQQTSQKQRLVSNYLFSKLQSLVRGDLLSKTGF